MPEVDLEECRATDLTELKSRLRSWLATQEHTPGLYRYCTHALRPFSGESTAQAVGLLWELGALQRLSPEEREVHIKAVQSLQQDDGVFRDPLATEDDRIDKTHPWVKINEHLAEVCEQALALLGAAPRLPNRTPPIYDVAKLDPDEWIRSLDHRKVPWGRCHNVAFSLLHYRRQHGLMDEPDDRARRVYELIEQEMLNPADGMPGDVDHPIGRRIAGYYMLTFCYLPFGLPLPNPTAAIDLILRAQSPEGEIGEGGMCQNWDAMHVLNHVMAQTGWNHRWTEVCDLAGRLSQFLLAHHLKPDGGFSFHRDHCQWEHSFIRVAPKLPEGDMQGSLMALASLNVAHAIRHRRRYDSFLDTGQKTIPS